MIFSDTPPIDADPYNQEADIMNTSPLLQLCLRAATVSTGVFIAFISPLSSATVTHNCGSTIRSIVKTEEDGNFRTISSQFVNVTGASALITVPAGTTRCVKVRFSASATCPNDVDLAFCALRVLTGGVTFDPVPYGGVRIASGFNALTTHGFEWVKRLAPGSYMIQLQARVEPGGEPFSIPIWTLDIEVAK
jgi:hypothetical protein